MASRPVSRRPPDRAIGLLRAFLKSFVHGCRAKYERVQPYARGQLPSAVRQWICLIDLTLRPSATVLYSSILWPNSSIAAADRAYAGRHRSRRRRPPRRRAAAAASRRAAYDYDRSASSFSAREWRTTSARTSIASGVDTDRMTSHDDEVSLDAMLHIDSSDDEGQQDASFRRLRKRKTRKPAARQRVATPVDGAGCQSQPTGMRRSGRLTRSSPAQTPLLSKVSDRPSSFAQQ
jgi:hypothetical protein